MLIEEQLDIKYAEYAEKLRALTCAIDFALERQNATSLSLKATVELTKLYRQCIKWLHPDLNPCVGEREKNFSAKIMNAYKNGDLDTVKTIWLLLSDDLPSDEVAFEELGSLEEMHARKDFLQAGLYSTE